MAMRQGNFSELLNSNIYYSSARIIRDPATNQAYVNNVIPTAQLSKNGMAFLNTYYAPNGSFGGNNWLLVRPGRQNQRKDTVSIDYNPSMNQFFKFRLANYSFTGLDTSRGGFDYAITDWSRPNRTGSLGYTWTVSPTTVNEFLVSASVDRVRIGIDKTGERYLRSRPGIDYPYIFPEKKEIYDKVPTIVPNVGTVDGGPYPPCRLVRSTSWITSPKSKEITPSSLALCSNARQNDFDQINVSGVPGGTNNQN